MATQKPDKYKVLRKFTKTIHKNGTVETISLKEGEAYRSGEYFAQGEFLPEKEIKYFLGVGVIELVQPSKTK